MKKTIFGVILAAFLVISVSWVAPIHVEAAETDPGIIKGNIQNLAEKLAGNDDFETLVEDSDIKNIIEKVYNPELRENEETIESLAQDYKDTIESKDTYNNLCDSYNDDFQQIYESLYELVYNKFGLQTEQNVEYLFNLGSRDKLEITEGENVDDESVFVDEQGNIKLPGYLWTGVNWSFVKELVKLFLVFGPVIIIVGAAIAALASIISSLLITLATTLTTLLTNIGLVVIGLGVVLVVLAIIAAVLYTILVPPPSLEEVFNIALNALEEESGGESEEINSKPKGSINEKIRQFIKKLLELFSSKAQHLFS